jgi:hypothetical protein
MTNLTSSEDAVVGDIVEYIGGGDEYFSKEFFTVGTHYVVGGKYYKYYDDYVGVIEDDRGKPDGHHFSRFKKVDSLSVEPPAFDEFDPWWNKYYPQEYGHNSEFRDIVTRHARRAFEQGKRSQ